MGGLREMLRAFFLGEVEVQYPAWACVRKLCPGILCSPPRLLPSPRPAQLHQGGNCDTWEGPVKVAEIRTPELELIHSGGPEGVLRLIEEVQGF